MKFIIVIISLGLSLVGYGQTSERHDTSSFKVIDRGSYLIQFPADWTLDSSKAYGSDLFIKSPKEADTDKFSENVNVLIQNLKGMGIDLDKFVQVSEGQIKEFVIKGEIIESKRLSKNGLEFHKIIYTGVQGIFTLKIEQYYFLKNERAFIVTLTTEENQFEAYKLTGEKILQSFKIKE